MLNKGLFYKIVFPLLFFVLLDPSLGDAQDKEESLFSFNFSGENLSYVLDTVAKEVKIDMVYDPSLVEGIHIYSRIKEEPIPKLLSKILANTNLDFLTLSSGTYVIVKKVNEGPKYGSYFGRVVDQKTGSPLPGANVMLADASRGTSTNQTGAFALNSLMSGSYKIIFSYVGYEPVYKTIRIEPDQRYREKISLEPKRTDFTPIVVTAHAPQLPADNRSSQVVASENNLEPLNNTRDPIRSLSLFSGIQYGLPLLDLHLQGGQRGEHRILLDGVPVYNPYSFGQLFSAFSPFAIGQVEIHKAGYGVEQGSQIAGLIDLKHEISSSGTNNLMAELDPLSLNLRGDVSLFKNENSSLQVAGTARSNYWNIYKEPTLQQTIKQWNNLDPTIASFLLGPNDDPSRYEPRNQNSDVRFYDVHLASRYEINPYNTLTASFYAGKNSVETEILQQGPATSNLPEFLYARDDYNWDNFVGLLQFDQLISPRLDLSTRLSLSTNSFQNRYLLGTSDNAAIPDQPETSFDSFQSASAQNALPAQINKNEIQHFIFQSDATFHFSPKFRLSGGLQADYINSQINLGDFFVLPTLSEQTSNLYSFYANGKFTFGTNWRLDFGNRFTYHSSLEEVYAQPRASIQYDREKTSIGYWSIRLSGGLYRQFINQFDITNLGPTSIIPSISVWSHGESFQIPKAWHLGGSFLLKPNQYTSVKLESFYKWQPVTYTTDYKNLTDGISVNRSAFDAFGQVTKLESFGAGIRIDQNLLDSKLKMLAGYDYNYSQINEISNFERRLTTPWNEPHRVQFRTLWHMLPNLSTVVKWQSILGRSWGFRQAYYDFLLQNQVNTGDFSLDTPENDRLSAFHQLDISFIYQPSVENVDLKIRMDLINILNRKNTMDWSLIPVDSSNGNSNQFEIQKRNLPGINPSLSIQFSF